MRAGRPMTMVLKLLVHAYPGGWCPYSWMCIGSQLVLLTYEHPGEYGLNPSASCRPCGFRREASCWDFVSGLGVGGAICPFRSWAVWPLFLSSLMGFWPTINELARHVADGFFIRGVLPAVFWLTGLPTMTVGVEVIKAPPTRLIAPSLGFWGTSWK